MKKIDIVQPTAMASIFAGDVYSTSGTTNFELPAETSTSATDTCVMDDGFLPITSEPLPPDGTGIAPERKNFNSLFYLSTDQRVYLQNGGLITYDSNVATKIGGYPEGAILNYIDSSGNLGFIRSLVDNNQYNFVTTPSYIDGINWEYANLLNFALLDPTFTNINEQIANCLKLTGNQTAAGTKTFSGKINVPNSISTGTALALAARGSDYIKLGDGTLIQWGQANPSSQTTNVTVSLAYTSSSSYVAIICDRGVEDGSPQSQKVIGYSSNKVFRVKCTSSNDSFNWLTIGR